MSDSTPKQGGWFGSGVAVAKDVVTLCRDGSLILLVILLLWLPETLNSVLVRAGFDEGTFVGFKWKAKLLDSDVGLKEANAKLSDVQRRNADLIATLNEAAKYVHDTVLGERIAQLNKDNKGLDKSIRDVQVSLASTIDSNSSLIKQAQSAATNPRGWAVVFGGDSTLERAKYEIDVTAKKFGIPNADIYLRQGSYRSVSVITDRADAEGVLLKARNARPDAYLVSMRIWCPNVTAKDGFQECR